MKPLSLQDIATAVSGTLNHPHLADITITGVSIDSRNQQTNNLFVAILGERFDGHDYIQNAFEKGAVCALSEEAYQTEKALIVVSNTKQALKDLAAYYRSLFNIPVVAITGSTGKTTTKDMIASVLETQMNVLKTKGNFNNEIGLPLTIFSLEETTEVLVVEMGMSNLLEIHNLSKIAKPTIAIITNIGYAHIEFLGSQENILKAKTEIFDFLQEDGMILLNGDDDLLRSLHNTRKNMLFYGTTPNNDWFATQVELHGLTGVSFVCNSPQAKPFLLSVPSPGKHMVLNGVVAAAVGELLNISQEKVAMGLSNPQMSPLRMEITTGKNNVTIMNDCYNANPVSMKAALSVLAQAKGGTVCVLGDMFELGQFSHAMHHEVGVFAAQLGIANIICVGNNSKAMYDGACETIAATKSQSKAFYFTNKEEVIAKVDEYLQENTTILLKASRGMAFEQIAAVLKKMIEVE